MKGISSVGFDILPTSKVAIEAKENIFNYNINELDEIIGVLKELTVPFDYMGNVNSFAITEGAYPEKSDKQLAYLSQWLNSNGFSLKINNLVKLCIINCLEDLSFTRKDGQYLRWDYRSKKVIQANESRKKRGIDPLKTVLDKGQLPDVIERITAELENIKSDINYVQKNFEKHNTKISFHQESVLKALPIIEDNYFSGVITSPPYCNRYDYTRTYALN